MAGNLRGTRALTPSVAKQPHALSSATSSVISTTITCNQSVLAATAPVVKQTKHASMRIEDGVAVITLDSPGVKMNSLNQEVMTDMELIFNECLTNTAVKSVV